MQYHSHGASVMPSEGRQAIADRSFLLTPRREQCLSRPGSTRAIRDSIPQSGVSASLGYVHLLPPNFQVAPQSRILRPHATRPQVPFDIRLAAPRSPVPARIDFLWTHVCLWRWLPTVPQASITSEWGVSVGTRGFVKVMLTIGQRLSAKKFKTASLARPENFSIRNARSWEMALSVSSSRQSCHRPMKMLRSSVSCRTKGSRCACRAGSTGWLNTDTDVPRIANCRS